MTSKNASEHSRTVPAVSCILDDGSLVELIHDPAACRTAFAIGNGSGVELAAVAARGNTERLVPLSANNNLIRHGVVLLPEKPVEYADDHALATDVRDYVRKYVDLSPSFLEVAVTYVLFSWVYDAFNELPYLRFRGDFGMGKTRALTVIGSLMYKGFFASGASTVSPIFYTLDLFRGALILDEADFRFSDEKAELSKILNNGNVAGFPVLRQSMNAKKEFDPRAFSVFGPKIVGSRRSFEDSALESRFLTEDMGLRPIRSDIPLNLPAAQKTEARALRNQLLTFRFRHRHSVGLRVEEVRDDRSARTNQIVVPLLSVAPNDDARAAIHEVTGRIEGEIATDRAQLLEAAILEVIAKLWANWPATPIPVSAIAQAVRADVGADTDRPITPKYVGFLLRKNLRLPTIRVGGNYVIPLSSKPTVEYLRRRFGLD